LGPKYWPAGPTVILRREVLLHMCRIRCRCDSRVVSCCYTSPLWQLLGTNMPKRSSVVASSATVGVVLFSMQALCQPHRSMQDANFCRRWLSCSFGCCSSVHRCDRQCRQVVLRHVLLIFERDRSELARIQREARQWLCVDC